jgi:hypothetical protein
MWLMEEQMETFRALSYGEKWRLRSFVFRGEAPRDSRLAAASAELAEGYQRQDRRLRGLSRWFPALLGVAFGLLALTAAIKGETVSAVLYTLIGLGNLAQYAFNPATRPKRVARSLAASKAVLAASSGPTAGEALPRPRST